MRCCHQRHWSHDPAGDHRLRMAQAHPIAKYAILLQQIKLTGTLPLCGSQNCSQKAKISDMEVFVGQASIYSWI